MKNKKEREMPRQMDSSNSGRQQPLNHWSNVNWDKYKGEICQENASNGEMEPMPCGLLLQTAVYHRSNSTGNTANFMTACARVSLAVHGLNADDMPKSGVVIHYGLSVPSLSCTLCREQSGACDKIPISGWMRHRNSIRHKSCNLRSIRALCPGTPPPPHGFGNMSEVKEYFEGLPASQGPTYANCMKMAFLVYNQLETYVAGKGFKTFIEHSTMEFEASKHAVAMCEEGTIEIWVDAADWFDRLDAHTRSGRKGGRRTTEAKRPRSQRRDAVDMEDEEERRN
jgi:hypothetical protein